MPEMEVATTEEQRIPLDDGQYSDHEPGGSTEESTGTRTETAKPSAKPAEEQEWKPPSRERFDQLMRERDGLSHTVGPLRTQLRELSEWKAQVERERQEEAAALAAIEADEEDEELGRLAEEDRVAWLARQNERSARQVTQHLQSVEQRLDAERQERARAQQAEQANAAFRAGREVADAFRQVEPNYDAAVAWFAENRAQALRQAYPQATDQQIGTWLAQQAAACHDLAQQNPEVMAKGGAPFLLYQYALDAGFQPPQVDPQVEPSPSPQGALARKRQALAGASSVSGTSGRAGGGDSITSARVAEMTDDEYMELKLRGFDHRNVAAGG